MPAIGVVITGIGICSPLGPDRETTWSRLLAGDRGPHWIDAARRAAGGAVHFPPGIDPRCKVGWLAEHVAEEACRDSGFLSQPPDAQRLGCVFGTSKGEFQSLLEFQTADTTIPPWTSFWPSAAATRVARRVGCEGPVLAPVAACATGLVACLRGAELIQTGHCDVVLAGSADASLFPAAMESFRRLGVLATVGDDPAAACRPFDRRRTGFLIGEGAACLVLERRSHAAARGAACYGEWLGGRQGSDPSGVMQVDASGETLARILTDLMARCRRAPEYLNLHGTATKTNDVAECRAIRCAFGAAAEQLACSGMKGSLGHLLGAAGSVELALTCLAVRDQVVPPTVNLGEQDTECALNLTPGSPQFRTIHTAIKISSGFGGHVAAAAIGRADGFPAKPQR